ncbi:hypothetical protein BDV41DRAFT_539241 [Aspergillus transmontanensis]|uniref:Uncharacterized protein n=1 Tax=Aspergillus transmontanensis TaxID=1034304 RepID=A0A5N6VUL1_9EURO|nr:hypothetical protein BDV41DRAFT_539241 [Aspergillus transmontanensis]
MLRRIARGENCQVANLTGVKHIMSAFFRHPLAMTLPRSADGLVSPRIVRIMANPRHAESYFILYFTVTCTFP